MTELSNQDMIMKNKKLIILVLLSFNTLLYGQFTYIQTFDNILKTAYPKIKTFPEFYALDPTSIIYSVEPLSSKNIRYFHGKLECELDVDSSVISAILKRDYSRSNPINSFPIELLYFFRDSIVFLNTAQYYLPQIDTIIPKMRSLQILWLYGSNVKNFKISKWNVPLFFLNLNGCELPTNIDVNQFGSSLKILEVSADKIKKNSNNDFSGLDNLDYFIFRDYSNTSQYSIIFPPKVKYIHFVNKNNVNIEFPNSTEILFLEIKNNSDKIPNLSNLLNLKFLSILPRNKFKKKNYVPVPDEVSRLKSLQSLQILYLNEENIEVISKIPHLSTLQIVEQKEISQNIYKLVNVENIEFSYNTPDSIIQSFRKALPNVKITRCKKSEVKSFF